MKKIAYVLIAMICCLQGVLCFPLSASAEAWRAPVIITEMMPGTAVSGSQEFIELYNQSDEAVDLTAEQWHVQITTSKATTWDKAKTVALQGVLQPGAYLILSSNYSAPGESKSYLQDYANAQFSSGLVAASGHVRLVRSIGSLKETVDQLEWTTRDSGQPLSPSIDGLQPKILDQALGADTSLKRKITDGVFNSSANNDADFVVSLCPSPTAHNLVPTESPIVPVPTTIDATNQECIPDQSDDPEEPIPQPDSEPPATLLPAENIANDSAIVAPKIPPGNAGLAAPQLTEILPNPGSPQTDAEDEFVELYNSNALPYDLSGYILRIGATGSKKYTFPAGTKLPPKSFVAFFSGDTRISLSNSSGKVVLFDPLEREISKTEVYAAAKDNQSWARAQGTWQWTARPTPNGENVILAPLVAKKATAKKASSTSKSPGATSTKKAQTSASQNASGLDEPQQKSPLHPLALAVVGGFAILYGAYEYRRDMANKFYQFRSYRAARRENRAQLEGR